MAEPETQEQKEPVQTPIDRGEGHPHWDQHLTREDVLRLIKENGGSAQGLDLAGAVLRDIGPDGIERGINLRGVDLRGVDLQGARLGAARLEGARLGAAHLRDAWLGAAHLEGAGLGTNLEGAFLGGAHLEGARLLGGNWQRARGIEDVHWGNYFLGEELRQDYSLAEDTYRSLKVWHTQHGLSDIAARFFYREMECRRKGTSFLQDWRGWLWLNLLWGPLGYGERPGRVVSAGLVVWLIFAAIYFAAGVSWGLTTPDIRHALYISAVSFTAVGYGPWVYKSSVQDWVQGVAAFESFIGVFMIAVFVTTFVRKMTR